MVPQTQKQFFFMFLVSFNDFLTISSHRLVILSEIEFFKFSRFRPILTYFLTFSHEVTETPQNQIL